MKKKVLLLLLIAGFCFLCTGCVGNVTRGIRHAGFTLSDTEFVCSLLVPGKDNFDYEKIRYITTTNKAITESGKVYDLSLGQHFSNEQNCKASDFTKKVVAIIDDNVVKAADDKYYYLSSNDASNKDKYPEVTENDQAYSIYSILFSDSAIKKVITADNNAGIYYALKNDGNVYKLIITRSDSRSPYVLSSSEIVYSKGRYGEIIDFNIDPNNTSTYIFTTDNIYRMLKTNRDECDKYADIVCNFELKEDTDLMKYENYILGYNGHTLITSYGKVFNVS